MRKRCKIAPVSLARFEPLRRARATISRREKSTGAAPGALGGELVLNHWPALKAGGTKKKKKKRTYADLRWAPFIESSVAREEPSGAEGAGTLKKQGGQVRALHHRALQEKGKEEGGERLARKKTRRSRERAWTSGRRQLF